MEVDTYGASMQNFIRCILHPNSNFLLQTLQSDVVQEGMDTQVAQIPFQTTAARKGWYMYVNSCG